MNVLGVVVKALAKDFEAITKEFEKQELCEVYIADANQGKIIITIEGADDSEALGKLRRVGEVAGVLATDLIHIASDTNKESVEGVDLDALDRAQDAEHIAYKGSVYHWLEQS